MSELSREMTEDEKLKYFINKFGENGSTIIQYGWQKEFLIEVLRRQLPKES
ncbi:MAG: hypothetical protein PHX08_01130 [Lachnospiraceae bacterium]|nr:hypothetical protein [Lachnospiraceae bacterium]